MDAQQLAKEVDTLVKRYCILPNEDAYVAVTLWVFHTHAIEAFEATPRLAIISPEKQCGKTRVLEVLALLCKDAKNTLNISVAAMYRFLDEQQPTLLMDEVDAVFNPKKPSEKSEELRGIINGGYRKNNPIIRCGEFGRRIDEFDAYAAMALASINALPDTVMDRAVHIIMRRRLPGETVASFRERTARAEALPLYEALAEWGAEASEVLPGIIERIILPKGLEDRPADIWEPLIAVADLIGGDWPDKARRASVNMTNAAQGNMDNSLGVKILRGIKQCFEEGVNINRPFQVKNYTTGKAENKRLPIVDCTGNSCKVSSGHLADYLNSIEGNQWAAWNGGSGINPNEIARYLKNYGIEGSVQVKIHKQNHKGYRQDQFEDVWDRYCKGNIEQAA